MEVNRKELLQILASIRPGLAKREIVEQASHFIFTGNHVTTFNDQICITSPYKTTEKFSVKGEEFYKILSGANSDTVKIEIDENHVKIGSKKMKAGLSVLTDDKEKIEHLIADMKKQIKEWKELPVDFLTGVFTCMFSASRDLSTGVLACVSIKENMIYSTDRYRASRYEMSESMEDSFFILAKDVAEILKFEVVEYFATDNWIHFRTKDKVTFSCRVLVGEYPELDRFFEIEGLSVTLPKELSTIVSDVSVLAEGDSEFTRSVAITIKDNEIFCKAKREGNWIEKSIDCDYDDEPINFGINPDFLNQILKKTTDLTIQKNKALFVSEGFQHIISLPLKNEDE